MHLVSKSSWVSPITSMVRHKSYFAYVLLSIYINGNHEEKKTQRKYSNNSFIIKEIIETVYIAMKPNREAII